MILVNFCTFWELKLIQLTKPRAPKKAKTALLELLDCLKFISRKIWVTEKSWNFHTVWIKETCYLILQFVNHKRSKLPAATRIYHWATTLQRCFHEKINITLEKKFVKRKTQKSRRPLSSLNSLGMRIEGVYVVFPPVVVYT